MLMVACSLEVGMSKVTADCVDRNLSKNLEFGFEFEIQIGRPICQHLSVSCDWADVLVFSTKSYLKFYM